MEIKEETNLKSSGCWVLSPFIINDDGGGDYTWAQAAALPAGWCSGSGTFGDPYIIENVTVCGNISTSCIEIRDSNVYFIIKNCTVYNSSRVMTFAGIKLKNTYNGQIIDNNCSNNNEIGILLWDSENYTISGNTVNNNQNYGILILDSNNNTISGNTVNNNQDSGICIIRGVTNKVTGNTVNYNIIRGIYLDSTYDNRVYNNKFVGNGINAVDDGMINQWDNGIIGNYWDDYTGIDKNDNGIGDTPYIIPGTAGSEDNFPIWDDGPDPSEEEEEEEPQAIFGYIIFFLIGVIGVISIILVKKRFK